MVVFGVVVVVAGLVGLAEGGPGRASHRPAAEPAPAGQATSATGSDEGGGLTRHVPATVVPAGTPVQEQYDQAFALGLGDLSGMTAAQALAVPTPGVMGGWPELAVEVSPEAWARTFVAGLLDIDYAHQSRLDLAAWLQAQEAPELIGGVPASVADKTLFISLLDPGIFGGQPTPVPTVAQWAANAAAGVTQSVSDLLVQADPGWAQMTAAGWAPTDVRMTDEDVAGALTVRDSAGLHTRRFTLQLITGSARWHDGYGTAAIGAWQER
jgi:hypothetical protein